MAALYIVYRYPSPPPPTEALEIQAQINNFEYCAYRGPQEQFIAWMLDVFRMVPKEEPTPLIELPPERVAMIKKNEAYTVSND
jgi:hypothetical protein